MLVVRCVWIFIWTVACIDPLAFDVIGLTQVTQLHSRGVQQVSYFANDSFGADPVPARGRALGTSTGLSDLTVSAHKIH